MNRVAEISIIVLIIVGISLATFFTTRHLVFQQAYAKGHSIGYQDGYSIGVSNGLAEAKHYDDISKKVFGTN